MRRISRPLSLNATLTPSCFLLLVKAVENASPKRRRLDSGSCGDMVDTAIIGEDDSQPHLQSVLQPAPDPDPTADADASAAIEIDGDDDEDAAADDDDDDSDFANGGEEDAADDDDDSDFEAGPLLAARRDRAAPRAFWRSKRGASAPGTAAELRRLETELSDQMRR